MTQKGFIEGAGQSTGARGRALPLIGAAALAATGALTVAPTAFAHVTTAAQAQAVAQAKVKASDGASGDRFGGSVATLGNLLLVGAPNATVNGNAQEGAVYVFGVQGSGASRRVYQLGKVVDPNGQAGDQYGASVAVSSAGVAVVGAPNVTLGTSTQFQGAAYEYSLSSNGRMIRTTTLTASDGGYGDSFGQSVAVNGKGVAVVGAPFAHGGTGAAYQFAAPSGRSGTVTQSTELLAANGQSGDLLGRSVAVSNKTIVAGAPNATVGTGTQTNQGAAYAFAVTPAGTAVETASSQLSASDGQFGDQFGLSVAIDGSTIAVGAPQAGASAAGSGAAYVFTTPAPGVSAAAQSAKLVYSDAAAGPAALGTSVSVLGNAVVAGAPTATVGANADQGQAVEFIKPAAGFVGTVTDSARFADATGAAADELGQAVSISSSGYIAAGAPNAFSTQGAGVLFQR